MECLVFERFTHTKNTRANTIKVPKVAPMPIPALALLLRGGGGAFPDDGNVVPGWEVGLGCIEEGLSCDVDVDSVLTIGDDEELVLIDAETGEFVVGVINDVEGGFICAT